jgi:S-adenosylmethionine:tRNA ribosyltransferase-isomerase
MRVSQFDYNLPVELIAQYPARRRDQSRLMVLDRRSGKKGADHIGLFGDVLDYFRPGDLLVVNNTKVFKARLLARRQTGARVEVFLIRKDTTSEADAWEAFVSPSRRVREGEDLQFEDHLSVRLIQDLSNGRWVVRFRNLTERRKIISRHGHVPLPHYIRRPDIPSDLRRYQTVFANPDREGAVAAPTAGFHFTRSLLKTIADRGIETVEVTLHVGPGTFKPVKVSDIEDHIVDPEFAELTRAASRKMNATRQRGGKIVAVGTTCVRTLESAELKGGEIQPFAGMVDLYVRPGFRFRVVDHLLTNFHLPKSSLIILVSAFAGRERILNAYREAISCGMRFYSYGDAMLIL